MAIAKESLNNKEMLKALLLIIYEGNDPLRWRAAWAIEKVSTIQSELIASERNKIISTAMLPNIPNGFRRLLLSILYNIKDENIININFFNFLLEKMCDPQLPPGVQSLAMKLANRMSHIEPDLHDEFICIVHNMELNYYSAGVKAAARKCLKKKNYKES